MTVGRIVNRILRVGCAGLMLLGFCSGVSADPFTMAGISITVAMEIQAGIAAASILASYLLSRRKQGALAPVDRGKSNDIRLSVPGYGEFMPKGWGTFRVAPIWIWESPAVDHPVTTPGQSGGKMPKPPTTAATVDHVYLKSIAGVFHDGPIYGGVRRIWFDNDLVYNDVTTPATGAALHATISSQKYEAEFGVLSSGAAVASQAECSAGKKVTGLSGALPTDIAGCKLWLKADSLALNDGDPVATWTDSSGNGNNATQASAGLKPTYKTSILNGKPVVRFDQTDDSMVTPNFSLAQPCTVFLVTKYRQARVGNDTLFDGLTNNTMRALRASSTNVQEYAGAFGPSITTTPESFHIYGFVYNGASSEIRVEGGTPATGNPSTGAGGGVTLNLAGGGGEPGGQDMAEIIVFDSVLSSTNRQKMEAYLGAKYGLTVASPPPSCAIKVTVPSTQSYELAVHYTSSSALSYNVSIDGGAPVSLACPSSGGPTIVAIATMNLGSLTAGDHTITFSNATAAAPDLDCIDIAPARSIVAIDSRSFVSAIDTNKVPPSNQDHAWAFNNFIPDPGDGGGSGGAPGTPHQTFNLGKYGQPSIRIYRGTTTQNADSAIVAQEGAGSASAYRGWSYLVIEGLQLQGGRVPNVTLEVDQGVHSVPAIVTDIYGLGGLIPSQLDVTALAGLSLGDSDIDPGTYSAITYANTANETHGGGGAIHKTSGANHAWNAYAAGTASIASGVNGAIRFTADVGPILVGMGTDSSPTTPTDVIAGIILNTTSFPGLETKNAIQFFNGTQGVDIGVWARGDVFQFEERNGRFRVYQNGIEIQSFTPSVPGYPLFPQIMMYDTGAGVSALTVSTSGAIGDAPSANAGGLLLTSRRSAGDLLADLQTRFQFDMVEVDGVVKAILRSGSTADITIPNTDMRAVIASPGSLPEIPAFDCLITDTDPFLLPARVDVNYLDPGMDYHNNVQSEMVLASSRYDQQSVSLAIVDSSDNMKKLAITLMHKAEMESRTFAWQTAWKYMHVHPGSIVSLTLPNTTHTVRVVQAKYALPAGVIEFQGVRQAASLYSPSATGSLSSGFEAPIAPVPQNTKGVIIDGPLLRAEDAGDGTEPVVYVAMCGRGAGAWSGAFFYEEFPIGSGNYELVTTASQASQIGVTSGALATVSDPSVWDRINSLLINFYTETTLANATEQDLLANAELNLLAIINPSSNDVEYLQFATAVVGTPVAPYISQYTVSTFLRGRIGTDGNVSSHTSADDVVVIDSTIRPRRMPLADIGR